MSVGLLVEPPATEVGTPIGVDDWRFAVEMVLPADDDARYDVARYDEDVYADVGWTDVTLRARGTRWNRGTDRPGDRPSTGVAMITLANADGALSPWAEDGAAFGPGTLVRILAHAPLQRYWAPLFAGVVESWPESWSGVGADSWVNVEVVESVALLARIDDNVIGSAIGTNDTAAQRIEDRLLAAAGWRFGFHAEADPGDPLQSTLMAPNRLAECHLTADSVDTYFATAKSGMAMLRHADARLHPRSVGLDVARYDTAIYDRDTYSLDLVDIWPTARLMSVFHSGLELHPHTAGPGRTITPDGRAPVRIVYDADSLRTANDPFSLENDVRLARAGGTQIIRQDPASIGQYGQVTYTRNDLIAKNDSTVTRVAEARLSRRSRNVLRVEGAEFNGRAGDARSNMPALMFLDHGDPCFAVLPDLSAQRAQVAGYEHRVTPLNAGRVRWETSISVERIGPASPAIVMNVAEDTTVKVSTPDHPDFDVLTGDMSLVVRGSIRRLWQPNTRAVIARQVGNFNVMWLYQDELGTGLYVEVYTTTGVVWRFLGVDKTPVLDILAETDTLLGITYDHDTGAGNFGIKIWKNVDGAGWETIYDLGGSATPTRSTASAPLEIGPFLGTAEHVPIDGAIAHFSIHNGLGPGGVPGGTLVARYDAGVRAGDGSYLLSSDGQLIVDSGGEPLIAADGGTEHLDPTGKIWTVSGSGFAYHYMPGASPVI